jgi:hypothetical protein
MSGQELERVEVEEVGGLVVIPGTGEVIEIADPAVVAYGLERIRELERELGDVKAEFVRAIRAESERQGKRTLYLGERVATVTGGYPVYDHLRLEDALRDAGLPEQRIREAVVETVTYKPNGNVLRQLRGASDAYASAIDAARTGETRVGVKVERAGRR